MTRLRIGWVAMIGVTGIITYFIGDRWLVVNAGCPGIVSTLLLWSCILAGVGLSLFAIIARINLVSQVETIALMVGIGLIVPAVIGPSLSNDPGVRSVYCPTCDEILNTAERNYSQKKLTTAEDLARECFNESPDASVNKARAGRLLAHVIFDKSDEPLNNHLCLQVSPLLDEAEGFAKEFETSLLATIQERRKNFQLVCPPATASPIPTLTLPPPPTKEIDVLCTPPNRSPIEVVRLTEEIKPSLPAPVARSDYFKTANEVRINRQFSGNEIVCIASTPDGKGDLVTDDRLLLQVLHDDRSSPTSQWFHDFYDLNAHGVGISGIKPYRAEDISRKFARGGNRLYLTLTDFIPPYYSSSPVYVIIW